MTQKDMGLFSANEKTLVAVGRITYEALTIMKLAKLDLAFLRMKLNKNETLAREFEVHSAEFSRMMFTSGIRIPQGDIVPLWSSPSNPEIRVNGRISQMLEEVNIRSLAVLAEFNSLDIMDLTKTLFGTRREMCIASVTNVTTFGMCEMTRITIPHSLTLQDLRPALNFPID